MSWYSFNYMKCKVCKHEYKQENSTLTFQHKGHDECPKCGGNVFVDKEKKEKEFIEKQNEIFKKMNARRKIGEEGKIIYYS